MAFAHPGPGLLQKSPETPPSETCPSRLVAQGKLNAWRAPRMALPIFCAAFWDPAPRSPAPPGISPRLPAWSRRGSKFFVKSVDSDRFLPIPRRGQGARPSRGQRQAEGLSCADFGRVGKNGETPRINEIYVDPLISKTEAALR
ncbi:uncharacterized protein LOC144580189 isoform X1 [Callithrix jacchus]